MKPVKIIVMAVVLFIPIAVFAQNTTLDNSTLLVENQSYENELNEFSFVKGVFQNMANFLRT